MRDRGRRRVAAWALAPALALTLVVGPALVPVGAAASVGGAADVVAGMPSEVSVTVYRAPFRSAGALNLDDLGGFALISEIRTVHVPAGLSRLRFAGVADGIEAASAIVTGLPSGLIEKNQDRQLLSPSALLLAARGRPLELLRTNRRTGVTTAVAGSIDAAGDGVVFKTADGYEALRCSGLSETFAFDSAEGLSATPTLSVAVRSAQVLTVPVTLSYLARGFDWAADYVATLAPDGRTFNLGAWVTLANGNGASLQAAHASVVAGRVNREHADVEPIDMGAPIFAQCWPQGTTSDLPDRQFKIGATPFGEATDEMYVSTRDKLALAAPAQLQEVVMAMRKVQQEQLGDLKLYQVPERTTVAARQSKQVRLLDRSAIPYSTVATADIDAEEFMRHHAEPADVPAHTLLRTTNDAAHHLGLALPSGHVAVFRAGQRTPLLISEAPLRDIAVAEEVELGLGEASDLQVLVTPEKTAVERGALGTAAAGTPLSGVPGVHVKPAVTVDRVVRVDISNAGGTAAPFELRLRLTDGTRVVRADAALSSKSGRPLFKLTVPANGRLTVRYQTQHAR